MSSTDGDPHDGPLVGDSAGSSAGDSLTPSPAQLAAAHVPSARIVLVGESLWLIALALTLIVPGWHIGERSWWPWACVSGFVLGGLGYAYVARGRGNAAEA